jgi:PAS domain S-box-containing protein
MQESPPFDGNLHGESSLHAQAEAFRLQDSILNAMGLAMISTNAGGTITSFNHTAEQLLGYTAAEVVGKATPMLFHDVDEMRGRMKDRWEISLQKSDLTFGALVASAFREKSTYESEWTFIRKDGSRFSARLTVVALRDKDDCLTGFAGMITDLTHQQILKDQLAASERKFRLLAENLPGAIYLCHNDETYSVIYLNDHIETLTGYRASDFFSGKITFTSLFHPDDSMRIRQTINEGVSARKGFHLRYRIRHASGEWRWLHETGVGVFEDDRLTMLEGYLSDITQQVQAEESLRRIADENLRFFNNPVHLNAIADGNGNLLRVSPSWAKMLGWNEDELKSRRLIDFVHPDDVESTREALRNILSAARVHTFENRFACKDGSFQWLLWAAAMDRQMQIFFVSAIDISERKKSEATILDSKTNLEGITQQLQQQNRQLDEFAHIISHNLRAPASNIQALINLLDERSGITDYKLIFDKIKNVSKNLRETMNELMDLLKARKGHQIELTDIRFKELLDKVVQSLEGELIVAQADVTFDFNEAAVVRYSKPYLESIFQNLLTNALKYRSPRRKPLIHFQSYRVDDHVELKVSDNGQGIDLERFGDKLFGLHKTFHDHQEARGVGLFLIKTQIEATGGRITVESEVDKGTTFTIRFN